MKALYLDSSAVAAWLFDEPTVGTVIRVTAGADVIVTSQLTMVECERAIHRAVAQRVIKDAKAQKLRGALERERSAWITMPITADILARAGRAFPVEPVRALDAIQLATALAFAAAYPELAILAFDRRISENANALGLDLA
jgi:predicted nucleic acid-binding protein